MLFPSKYPPTQEKNRPISQHGPTLLCNIASKKHGIFGPFPGENLPAQGEKSPPSPATFHAFVKFFTENVKNLYTKPVPHVL